MTAEDRAARAWFGYGRWQAPYWFIGMEPGGTEHAASYESWERLGGAFEGKPAETSDALAYQHHEWGSKNGETALIELGALHAPSLASVVDRETYRQERIKALHERLERYQPVFALCYGLGYREQFEQVVGSAFDSDGFTRCGKTLCVLTPGPTSRVHQDKEWWIDLGKRMRAMVEAFPA